ncbi:copper resistance protein CopC [Nonomuraea sp. NPDC050556]|uniref:copper resistance protein CopC n=1 Tax=Nonomuraea sp. NPDC050556 TaxID=3364369 RepID=UPI003798FC44
MVSRFIRALALVGLACSTLLSFNASTALAHDGLKSSSPAKNAKISSPEKITLEYTAKIRLPAVVLHDADGNKVATDKAQAEGRTVTAKVSEALAPGKYVIGWRVVSSDGHPLEGEIPFTVTAPATPTPTPSTSTSVTEAPNPVVTSGTPVAAAEEPAQQGIPSWVWVTLGAVVIVGIGIFALSSRRSS